MFRQLCFVLLGFVSNHLLAKPRHFCSSSTRKITRLTKQECLLYLQNCKSMKELKHIHSQVFRVGLSQNRDPLNKLMVFCTNPVNGNLNYAEKIFNHIQEPYLFAYNLMIKAFAKVGSLKKAISLFCQLREEGLSPDNFTYPFVLKAIGCLGLVSEGKKVHGYTIKTGLEFDSYVRNSFMDMYAEMGNFEILRQLFEEMPNKDVVCWNILISGYVRCGRFKDAISVFREMEEGSSVRPDEASVVSTLTACVALGDLEFGKELHCYVNKELEFTTVLGNALLDMYAKCGCLSLAHRLFDEMPVKNVITWTSIVSGYVNFGKLDEARQLFDRSPEKDVILWTSLINGYVQFNRFDEALALFHEMQIRRVKPDKFTIVALLTGCAQLGALEQGRWIHGYIKENNIRMDTVLGTALIDMYAKCGCIDKSLEIFRGLETNDTASWTAYVYGLAMNGQTKEALELFSEMLRIGVKPDDITFIGVLSACNHGGLVDEGCRYFNSMMKIHDIEPKIEHYGCLVDLLGRAGRLDEAEALIEEIKKDIRSEDLVPLWGSLLSACRIHGDVEMGERVAKQISGIESSNSGIHTLVANIYAAADRWGDVMRVRRKMKDVGVKKVPGCSSIEVDGIVHEFLVGDTSHPKVTEIYCLLNDMAGLVLDLEENAKTVEI